MDISLYQNFAKRKNSTKIPTSAPVIKSVRLKQGCSIHTPVFIFADYEPSYNYIKWGDSYYYVDDVIYQRNSIIEVSCTEDVLATYRQEIFSTTAFVEFSSSDYDIGVPDTRLSSQDSAEIHNTTKLLLNDAFAEVDGLSGTFILNYVTDTPTFGAAGIAYLTAGELASLAEQLTSTGFLDFLNNYSKQFLGAYDSILSCKYVPFSWAQQAGA